MTYSTSILPFSSVKSTNIAQARDATKDEYNSDDFVVNDGPSYDDYDDFPIGMSGNVSGGGARQHHQKRNKTNQQQIYSSKHTRIRENRVSSAKTASPQR